MVGKRDAIPKPNGAPTPEDRLDSWKEIAAYLGRGIRTVQRWEREEGLPVHRLAHDKRGSIYARREELAAWWESRRVSLAVPSTSEAPSAPAAPGLERVTQTSAMTSWPVLSSDARLIAYVSDADDGMTPQIWIQQVGGAALRLTNRAREYSHLSFSPDDTRIIFTGADELGLNVYEVPTLGGEPRLLQRAASHGSAAPNRLWLACVPSNDSGIRIVSRDGSGGRSVGSQLVDVACVVWAPDSRSVLAYARAQPTLEPDWWMVPIDGTPPIDTRLVARLLGEANLFTMPTGAAWVGDSLIFSAASPNGINLYRQRIAPFTSPRTLAPQRLTTSSESAWFPTAAGGRLAFISSRADANLWSVAIDPLSGIAHDPLRRMTRGPGILGYLSLTSDFRRLAYFSVRLGGGDVFVRDLRAGSERVVVEGPAGAKWYPAISPSGRLLAYGTRMPGGERALRPIFIVDLSDGAWRKLGDDCGGRPREWVDERQLVIERFARLNSIATIDTETADQQKVLESADWSIRNPRLSPDRQWIAFDALRPGESTSVCVAPFGGQPIPESAWMVVDRAASHPFWSADGRLIYYTPTGTNPLIRSTVRACRFAASGCVDGEPFPVYASTEMLMPTYLTGTAPVATPDEIILVLGDFRGDIWLMDLDTEARAGDVDSA
jgi:Tol biopolymer transport system component